MFLDEFTDVEEKQHKVKMAKKWKKYKQLVAMATIFH